MNFLEQIFKTQSKDSLCPYCNKILEKKPQRKMKCLLCNKDIYVRSKQKIFHSTLLTKDDAMAVDWLRKLEEYEVRDRDFIKKKKELSNKFNSEARSTDVIWALFNDLLLNTKELYKLRGIYYSMALFLAEEGKDFFKSLQQSRKMSLIDWKKEGFIKRVSISTSGKASCEACQKLDGRIFTLEEALEQLPIPSRECTTSLHRGKKGFCRCVYIPEIDE